MHITKKEYDKHIKPFFDKLYDINLSSSVERVLVGDFVIGLLKKEYDLDALKSAISNMTKIQEDFLVTNGMEEEIKKIKEFFKV